MSHSRVSCFNGCPYQYKLKYIDGLEKIEKTEFQNDSVWGSAIHKALEKHYKGGSEEEVIEEFKSYYPEDLSLKDEAKTVEGGVQCLKAYRTFYKEQDKDWEVLETEIKDTVLNDGDSHNLVIDLVARHKPSQTIYAWDHKTTTADKMKYSFWKRYELDSQVTMYTEYLIQRFGSCAGFWVNGIAVGHRKRMYKGEPAGHYQKFERNLFSRSPKQIEAWKESDKQWRSLMDYAMASGSYPKALNGLCNYCEFQDLCVSADDEQILELLYQTKTKKEN